MPACACSRSSLASSGVKAFLPALVHSLGLGEGDPFPLALSDQVALEGREPRQHREHQLRHRIGLAAREGELVPHELDRHAALRQFAHDPQQVLRVPCQPVEAVDN